MAAFLGKSGDDNREYVRGRIQSPFSRVLDGCGAVMRGRRDTEMEVASHSDREGLTRPVLLQGRVRIRLQQCGLDLRVFDPE